MIYSTADYDAALSAIAVYPGSARRFKVPGLPTYASLFKRQRADKTFSRAFASAMSLRNETRKSNRDTKATGARWTKWAVYSESQIQQAITAFASWEGRANDFKPRGLPKYFYLSKIAKTCPESKVAKDFELARASRFAMLKASGSVSKKRKCVYTHKHFEDFLAAIQSSTCRHKTEFILAHRPGLPVWKAVMNYAKKNADFADKLQAALEAKSWQKGVRSAANPLVRAVYDEAQFLQSITLFSNFTGHSHFYFKPPSGLPGYPAIIRAASKNEKIAARLAEAMECRLKYRPLTHVGRGHKRVVTDADKLSYLSEIRNGTSRRALERSTVFTREVRERVCREDPSFAAATAKADRARLEAKFKAAKERRRAREQKRRRDSAPLIGQLRVQLSLNQYYATADAALRNYRFVPSFELEDIRSDMVEALIAGELLPEDASDRAFEYVANYNREFSPRNFASTDQKLFDDGSATRGDYLTTDVFSYAE